MIKALVGKFGTLALFAAVAGSSVVACSSDVSRAPGEGSASNDGKVGGLDLKLVPVSGVTLNSVNYVVTGTPTIPGSALPSGVLPTPGTASTFNVGFPIPVGTGYTLSLTGASAETGDDITCTGAFGPFNVTANNATNVSITLTCRDNSNGQVIAGVDVKTDACPRLLPDYVVAIPASAAIGSNVAVNALGHDLDGKPVTYKWSIPAASAAVGSFAAANAQSTSFACAGPGANVPVTVTLSNGECTKPFLTTLSCTSVTCGNGTLDAGETCDPAIAAGTPGGGLFGCPADCTVTCGDGNVESPAEQCELPAGVPTAACTAQCRNRTTVCGDGFITGAEQCDGTVIPAGSPAGSTCSATCTLVTPAVPVCGDGVVAAGEECEPKSSQTCSDTCQRVATDACVTCEQNGACAALSDACLNFTGADRTLCYAVQECITDTNCGDGTNTLTSCFCGSLTTAACIAAPASGAGSPAGACAAKIRSAMAVGGVVASNNDVLVRYIDETIAGGAAIARYNCDKVDPACLTTCGF